MDVLTHLETRQVNRAEAVNVNIRLWDVLGAFIKNESD